MKGIFIPEEILNINELNFEEKGLLSIYKYYTEEGDMKCCSITNSRLQEILGIKRTSLYRYKKHLKKLGLITTNGGIEVKYNSTNLEHPSTNLELNSSNLELNSTNLGPIIKKEKEIKKELIKDNKDLIKDEVAEVVAEEEHVKDRFNEILTTMNSYFSDKKDWLYDNKKQAIDTMNSNNDLSDQQIKDWIVRVVEKQFGNMYSVKEQQKKEEHKISNMKSDFFSNNELMEDRGFSDKYNSIFDIQTPGKDSMFNSNISLKDRFDI